MFFIKTLMNVDQTYSYLLNLKLKIFIGPDSNLWLQKMNAFHFVKENLISSVG